MKKRVRKGKKKATNSKPKKQIRIDHKGSLQKVGFNESESEQKEKQAIRKADKKYGVKETDLKLAALEAFNTHKKRIHDKIRSLLKWNEEK